MDVVNSFAIEHVVNVGGKDLLADLVAMFKDMDVKITEARTALAAGDLAEVYKSVHALRSGASNLGLDCLLECTARIEHKTKAEISEGVSELLDELEEAYKTALKELELIVQAE